jgi:hypothetical protein
VRGAYLGGVEVVSKLLYVALTAVLTAAAAFAASPAGAASTNDALTAARFSITVDGVQIARFSEFQIASEGRVVLRRGTDTSLGVFAWHQTVVEGQISAAKDASVVMYGADGKPVARYHLENAWPSKLEIAELKAGTSEVSYETVTLVCDHLQRISP